MEETEVLTMREGMSQWERKLVDALGLLDGDLEEFYDSVPLPGGHDAIIKAVRPKLFLRPASGFL